jgi:3-oxoacyl-[acyl-carrier protein] reductase
MMKRRAGRIVSIASIVGVTGNAGQANYAAAKAGLIGMSKALAQEVAPRTSRSTWWRPASSRRPMTDKLNEAQRTTLLSRIPLGKMGAAKDVAAAVAYLASDEAAWVTGRPCT